MCSWPRAEVEGIAKSRAGDEAREDSDQLVGTVIQQKSARDEQ